MATYALDLTQSEAALLAEFSVVSSAGSATLSKVDDGGTTALKFAWVSENLSRHVALWAPAGAAIATTQVLALVRHTGGSTTIYGSGVGARLTDSITGYVSHAFSASVQPMRLDVGSGTFLGTSDAETTTAYRWRRVETTGTTIRHKSWAGTLEDEPAAWLEEVTDATYASGEAGLFVLGRGANPAAIYVAEMYVGTNGDPAAPPSGGAVLGATSALGVAASANIDTSIQLATSVSVGVAASAGLATGIELAAVAGVGVLASAALDTSITLLAAQAIAVDAAGALGTDIWLASQANAQFAASADLEAAITLAASAPIDFAGTGALYSPATSTMSPLALLNF